MKNLGTLCSIDTGDSDTKDAVSDGPFAFFDRSRTPKRSTRYLFDCEAIIIPGEGTEFLPRRFVGKFDLHQRAYALHNFSHAIDPVFLYHYLHARSSYWSEVAVGATVKSLRRRHFEGLTVPVPPLSEQQRIVTLLNEAFEGIDAAVVLAERNLAHARDLPKEAIRHALDQFDSCWDETIIGAQITLQRGVDITKASQRPGPVPVVSSGGIRSHHDEALVKAPGVVMGRKGTLGKVFYLEQDFWPHDTSLYVKDFKGNDARFVYYLFKVLDVSSLDSGAANPALNRNVVHALPVRWPPLVVQRTIVSKLDGIVDYSGTLVGTYERKLAALVELKQSLLARAFSGELTREPLAA